MPRNNEFEYGEDLGDFTPLWLQRVRLVLDVIAPSLIVLAVFLFFGLFGGACMMGPMTQQQAQKAEQDGVFLLIVSIGMAAAGFILFLISASIEKLYILWLDHFAN